MTNAAVSVPAQQAQQTQQQTEQAPAPQKDLSSQISLLARKEKAAVQKQREVQAKEAELMQRLQQFERERKEYEEERGLYKSDPWKYLEKVGHKKDDLYKTLTNEYLNDGKVTPEEVAKTLREELAAVRNEFSEYRKSQEEAKSKEQEQAIDGHINAFKEDLKTFVDSQKDKFKLTSLFDRDAELIYDVIEENFEKTQEVMSHEKAADLVEKYFIQLVEQANKALGISKRDEPHDPKEAREQVKTLTNQINSSAPSMLPAKTENDRLKRALAALG
jgi:hypothetical protein